MHREWPTVDYYAVLGVAPTADQDEITHAFHTHARYTHPDTHPNDPAAEEAFKRVSAAYDVLGDPATRADYDRVRGIGVTTAGPTGRPGPNQSHSEEAWAGPPGYDPNDEDLWEPWPPPAPRTRTATKQSGRRVWVRPTWFPDPWMIAVVGVILVGTAIVVDWQDSRVPDGWIESTALVTREFPPADPCFRNCSTDYWIEAPTTDGSSGHVYDGPADVGERRPFAYDPEGSRWKVLNQGRYIPWTMGLPGVLLLCTAALLALFSVKRRRMPFYDQRLTGH